MRTHNNLISKSRLIKGAIITLILIAFAALAFCIRMISFDALFGTGNMMAGPDGWYYLRQVELSVAYNFENIPYDPYMSFPGGGGTRVSSIFVRICAAAAMLSGCITQIDFINVISFVPPCMAACMIPVMYFLGKKLGDWKTGLVAALFITVLSGQYLARTMYGYIDHHAAETLLSSLFCLSYVVGLSAVKNTSCSINIKSWKKPALYGLFAGFTFFLGFQNLYVMSAFGFIVLLFTVIQFVINQRSNKPSEYLLVFNTVTFLSASAGYFILGIFGISSYSVTYLLAHLIIVIATVVLYAASKLTYKFKKSWKVYLIAIIGICIEGIMIFKLFADSVLSSFISTLTSNLTNGVTSNAISEMGFWTLPEAFTSYNLVLLLAVGGCIFLTIRIIKHQSPEALFVLVWSAILFMWACAHVRFEYYLVTCIALLGAICVTETIRHTKDVLPCLRGKENTNAVKGVRNTALIKIFCLVLVLCFTVEGVGISAATSINIASHYVDKGVVYDGWHETCEWIKNNTPDIGIPVIDTYSSGKSYESIHAYGILSWCDYGYYIIELAKRIPITNPGYANAHEGAQIFLQSDEKEIADNLESFGVRYVITDDDMCSGFFYAMCSFADSKALVKPYAVKLTKEDGSVQTVHTPAFYNALVTRLNYYDGSAVRPESVNVVYAVAQNGGTNLIESELLFDDADKAEKHVKLYNRQAKINNSNKYAYRVSANNQREPNTNVEALTCFRLVYENSGSKIKVFEFVDGAHIRGDGTIECTVTTNQGRVFTYSQDSVNGEFIVPYVTGKNGDVTASEYRIIGTGETLSVQEYEVMTKEYYRTENGVYPIKTINLKSYTPFMTVKTIVWK